MRYDLIYVEGAGDIVEAMNRWHHGEEVISETSKTFSGQVFDFCKKNQLSVLAVSAFHQKKSTTFSDGYAAKSYPKRVFNGGFGYHFSQLLYAFRLILLAILHRPRYFHITNGVTHLIFLAPLKLFGVKIFPQFHNTFWPKGYPPTKKSQKIFLKIDAWFLKHIASGALCCSPEIERQIAEITQGKSCPTYVFKAQFNRSHFENTPPIPAHTQKPFTVVFAGRIERDKGVFDILEMAQHLKNEPIVFHICGGGSELENLQRACLDLSLKNTVSIHGKLNRPDLIHVYSQAHTVIVPTRSDFCEGLPMVGIEAILLGRPLITSSLSNALDVLGNAIIEAKPENIESYVSAIKKLADNQHDYNEKQSACSLLREQFLDSKGGLTQLLNKTL